MFRIFFVALLLLSVEFVFAQPAEELTLAQKEELLDKAKTALLWFRDLGNEYTQNRTAPEKYKEQITPMELLQAAALLNENKEEEQASVVEQLLLMLPFYRLTPEELFEIQDVLGSTALPNLADASSAFLDRIPLEAANFRTKMLNNAEKVILYQEPATALELMNAVDTLSVVGRPVLVRHYLRKFLNDEQYSASPEESAKIVETLGTQKLMQLAAHPDFVPLGKEVAAKIIDEAKKHWQDEAKIAEALKETNWFKVNTAVPNTTVPQVNPAAKPALKILWKGENISVQQGFQILGEIKDDNQADELSAVLLSVRSDMKEAFAAALDSGNSKLKFHAARGLAMAVSPQEGFLLYAFLYDDKIVESERETVKNILKQRKITIPNQEQAAAVLYQRGNDYLEHRRPLRTESEGQVFYWAFDNSEQIEYHSLENVEKAYKLFADRYLEQSYRIVPKTSPQTNVYKSAHIISHIEYLGSLPPDIDITSPDEAEELLQNSLDKQRFIAAASLIAWLAEQGDAELLTSENGKPRLLVQAVVAKDRRVRFAALSAIMKLNPTKPFAGSSLVADTLVWFSKSEGQKIVLSGHNQMAIANQTASMLLGDGYTTDVAVTCRKLFERAADSPDVEIVFVDARTPQPPVGEFLQIMRQDARTAEIPIAVLSGNERALNPERNLQRRTAMMRFDRRDPDSPFRTSLSLNYPRIISAESAQWIREDLLEKTGVNIVPPEERLEHARQALDWLKEIKEAEQSESAVKVYHFDDFDSIVLNALHSENRVEQGLALAAAVKSPAVQSAVYELAANVVYPMKLRELAGNAFEQSVETFGVLLRGNQVQRLYDRYNLSESEPKESQKLLSRLIDAVEKTAMER